MEELRLWMTNNYGAHMWHRFCNNNKRSIVRGHRSRSIEEICIPRDYVMEAFQWDEDRGIDWCNMHNQWRTHYNHTHQR